MGRLTRPQIKRLAMSRGAKILGGESKGAAVIARPNGRPGRTRPNRRPARGAPVAAAQSYLNVDRC